MWALRIRHSSHEIATQSSHSVDRAVWQAKMASSEFWIPWGNAHGLPLHIHLRFCLAIWENICPFPLSWPILPVLLLRYTSSAAPRCVCWPSCFLFAGHCHMSAMAGWIHPHAEWSSAHSEITHLADMLPLFLTLSLLSLHVFSTKKKFNWYIFGCLLPNLTSVFLAVYIGILEKKSKKIENDHHLLSSSNLCCAHAHVIDFFRGLIFTLFF